MAGVIGIIAFSDDAKYAAESIDHEVVSLFASHVLEQSLAGSPQSPVLVLFKGGNVALRGMENDPGRVKPQPGRARLHPLAGKGQIGTGLCAGQKLVLHLETVAVQLKASRRL